MARPVSLAAVTAAALLSWGSVRAHAQHVAPAAVTAYPSQIDSLHSSPRIAMLGEGAEWRGDVEPNRPRGAFIGGLVGAGIGVALGYGLAHLGQAMYCEGQAQCSEYPRRAIRESTRAGFVIGGAIGALIGWHRN